MSRYRTPTTHVDPEVEELRLLNSKIEENRKQDKIVADYVTAILRKQEEEDLVAADKRYQRRLVRKYESQMDKLADRVALCLLFTLGVFLLKLLGLLSAEILYWALSVCTYVLVFFFGTSWDKLSTQGGDKR